MSKCSICGCKNVEVYAVDAHLVCEACLTQGRLDEIPDLANADKAELELVGAGAAATMLSSWWNRDIPDTIENVR